MIANMNNLKNISFIRLVGLGLLIVSIIQIFLAFLHIITPYFIIPILATLLVYTRLEYTSTITKQEWEYRLLWTSIGFIEIAVTITYLFFSLSSPLLEILVISGILCTNAYRYMDKYCSTVDMNKFNQNLF